VRIITVNEAQACLQELVLQAQEGAIGLTDEDGNLVGLLSGVDEENIDDLLVQTLQFKTMIAESIASLETSPPISASELLAEARAEIAKERAEKRARRKS
jgi:hypothetical protein